MNKFLETMVDWYQFTDNIKKIVSFCAYVMRSSMAKLYAARYKRKSQAKVCKKASRDLSLPLRQSIDNRTPIYAELLRLGLANDIAKLDFLSHVYDPYGTGALCPASADDSSMSGICEAQIRYRGGITESLPWLQPPCRCGCPAKIQATVYHKYDCEKISSLPS
ncbi:nuclear intron maturase 1, mitochondrial, partial [Tanacetum coccineum]